MRQGALRPAAARVAWLAALWLLAGLGAPLVHAQAIGGPDPAGSTAAGKRTVLRFLTENDFPPFDYVDDEGVLAGLNVDLARQICVEANLTCDIQVRPWGQLLADLKAGKADVVIAGHRQSPKLLTEFDASEPYLTMAAAFAGKRGGPALDATPEGLEDKRIAVVKGSAHEAYLTAFFRDSKILAMETSEQAREALLSGKADVLFEDGIALMFWLNGTLSHDCCELEGGAYFDPKYFGEGMVMVLPKGDRALKATVDTALQKIRSSGRLEELTLRYLPLRLN